MSEPKFKVGDKVKVVNYGHAIWRSKKAESFAIENESRFFGWNKPTVIQDDSDLQWIDIAPEIVGKKGVIETVEVVQGKPQYAIKGIAGKHSWYNESQLELCNNQQTISPNTPQRQNEVI